MIRGYPSTSNIPGEGPAYKWRSRHGSWAQAGGESSDVNKSQAKKAWGRTGKRAPNGTAAGISSKAKLRPQDFYPIVYLPRYAFANCIVLYLGTAGRLTGVPLSSYHIAEEKFADT